MVMEFLYHKNTKLCYFISWGVCKGFWRFLKIPKYHRYRFDIVVRRKPESKWKDSDEDFATKNFQSGNPNEKIEKSIMKIKEKVCILCFSSS